MRPDSVKRAGSALGLRAVAFARRVQRGSVKRSVGFSTIYSDLLAAQELGCTAQFWAAIYVCGARNFVDAILAEATDEEMARIQHDEEERTREYIQLIVVACRELEKAIPELETDQGLEEQALSFVQRLLSSAVVLGRTVGFEVDMTEADPALRDEIQRMVEQLRGEKGDDDA